MTEENGDAISSPKKPSDEITSITKDVDSSVSKLVSEKLKDTGMVDYRENPMYTAEEVDAIGYYQDHGHAQHKYDCEIPKDEIHVDCYITNGILRHEDFKAKLSPEDLVMNITEVYTPIKDAMKKSTIKSDVVVFKGLDNGQWFLDEYQPILNKEGIAEFRDKGFESTSLSFKSANRYTTARKYTTNISGVKQEGEFVKVFLRIYVKKGHNAIYLKEDDEFLLDTNFIGVITDCTIYNKGELIGDAKAILYTIIEQ